MVFSPFAYTEVINVPRHYGRTRNKEAGSSSTSQSNRSSRSQAETELGLAVEATVEVTEADTKWALLVRDDTPPQQGVPIFLLCPMEYL